MQITSAREDGKLTVSVEGRVDTNTAPELEKYINDNLGDAKELVLDLAELKYTSSAGLRVLLKTQKQMNAIGSMKVVHVQSDVMEIFEMTGFSDILDIE